MGRARFVLTGSFLFDLTFCSPLSFSFFSFVCVYARCVCVSLYLCFFIVIHCFCGLVAPVRLFNQDQNQVCRSFGFLSLSCLSVYFFCRVRVHESGHPSGDSPVGIFGGVLRRRHFCRTKGTRNEIICVVSSSFSYLVSKGQVSLHASRDDQPKQLDMTSALNTLEVSHMSQHNVCSLSPSSVSWSLFMFVPCCFVARPHRP